MEEDYELEKTETYPPSNVILDSEVAVAIANSDKDTKQTRHILCRYHFVQQAVVKGHHILGWCKGLIYG